MQLINLGKRRHQDIGMVLAHLSDRYERGELRGLALCVKDTDNIEDVYIAGTYRYDSGSALGAAMRMSLQINGQ